MVINNLQAALTADSSPDITNLGKGTLRLDKDAGSELTPKQKP